MIKSATTNIWSLSRTMCWWKKVREQWVHHHLSCQRRSRWDNIVGRGANTSWTSSAHLLLSLNPSPCELSRPSSAFSTCVCLQLGWGGRSSGTSVAKSWDKQRMLSPSAGSSSSDRARLFLIFEEQHSDMSMRHSSRRDGHTAQSSNTASLFLKA